jgi:hypothetical protein
MVSSRCGERSFHFQPGDSSQNSPKQLAGNSHLGKLERHVFRVPRDLRTDLDQLLPQRCQRPVLHVSGQGKPTQEVGEIVRQSEQLQSCLVILDRDFPFGIVWNRSRLGLLPIVTACAAPASSASELFSIFDFRSQFLGF